MYLAYLLMYLASKNRIKLINNFLNFHSVGACILNYPCVRIVPIVAWMGGTMSPRFKARKQRGLRQRQIYVRWISYYFDIVTYLFTMLRKIKKSYKTVLSSKVVGSNPGWDWFFFLLFILFYIKNLEGVIKDVFWYFIYFLIYQRKTYCYLLNFGNKSWVIVKQLLSPDLYLRKCFPFLMPWMAIRNEFTM